MSDFKAYLQNYLPELIKCVHHAMCNYIVQGSCMQSCEIVLKQHAKGHRPITYTSYDILKSILNGHFCVAFLHTTDISASR